LDESSASHKGLYLYRATQHRNAKTNIHASSEIQTPDPSNQAGKTYAFGHAATRTVHTISTLKYIIGFKMNKGLKSWDTDMSLLLQMDRKHVEFTNQLDFMQQFFLKS
jgi:hypothetical protein